MKALNLAANDVGIVACTDGANGAYIMNEGELYQIPAKAVKIVDTTGAGDIFAAGFLWGILNEYDIQTCGYMGCVAGSDIVTQFGARSINSLLKLFDSEGLV